MELLDGQCRAARALLSWSQGELGQRARVDQKTIADFERGMRNPHPRTIEALVKAFESAGIVFIEPTAAFYSGVALKTGVELLQRQGEAIAGASGESTQSSAQAEAWDNDLDALSEDTPLADDPEIEDMRAFWRANPERWAAMHASTRLVLLQEMGLRKL